MKLGPFLTATDVVIAVPVTFDSGHPWTSLAGVVIEARAGLTGTATVVDATVSQTDTALTLRWNEWELSPGIWTIEVIGTKDSLSLELSLESRTLEIRPSLKPQP